MGIPHAVIRPKKKKKVIPTGAVETGNKLSRKTSQFWKRLWWA